MRRLVLALILLATSGPREWASDPGVFCDATISSSAGVLTSRGTAFYLDSSASIPPSMRLTGLHYIVGDDFSLPATENIDSWVGQWTGTLAAAPLVSQYTCFQARVSVKAGGLSQEAGSPKTSACIDPSIYQIHPWGGTQIAGDDYDPLIIDLNGDGIQTTGVSDEVWFDLDGNGSKDLITWTNGGTMEGFLWVNLTGKNRVDNGSELFGIGTVMPDGSKAPDGFTALGIYDTPAQGGNGDGVIDANDAVWHKLRVWVDANHNGVCDPGEVSPLAEYGIDGISLAAGSAGIIDSAGNTHARRSQAWRNNGRKTEYLNIESIGFRGTLH